MTHTFVALKKREESKARLNLSVSKAKTFLDCKAKFKFCYLDKLPRKEQDFHIFGKFLHSVLENFHRAIINEPELRNDYPPVLKKAWEDALAQYADKLIPEQVEYAKKITDEYELLLVKTGIPNVTSVEKEFYIQIDDRILLNGFIDRIQDDADLIHVADYKTTKEVKYLANDFFQLKTYGFVLAALDPAVEKIRASYIMLKHNFRFLTKEFTRKEVITEVLAKFVSIADNIEAEKVWRPNPTILCKYCDYLENCNSGRRYLEKKGMIERKTTPGVCSW